MAAWGGMAGEATFERVNGAALAGGPVRSLQANPAITHLRRALQEGTPWYLALLDAIGLWEEPCERYRGQERRYLIAGEALDWLLLAERLASEAPDLIPRAELEALLFQGRAPLQLSSEEFRERIGPLKYRCLLSYFYGVTVEEALFFALEEEARRHSVVPAARFDLDPLYQDLYGSGEAELLADFTGQSSGRRAPTLDVPEQRAFTYFLFKRRIAYCLPPRVASDTKRGLAELRRQYLAAGRATAFPGRPDGTFDESGLPVPVAAPV